VINDIRNRDLLKKEIAAFSPDIIFHLAAQPLVRRSYEIPAETFEVNVTGTANLLEAAISIPKKCAVIVITTDKVYFNKEQDILYNEDDMLGGHDPYSASKACCEIVCESFRKSFFNQKDHDNHQKSLATVRAGNVIGGGDRSRDRLLPDIIYSLIANKIIPIRNPSAVRPWQHVLEAISGYLLLGIKLYSNPSMYGKPFNFGPVPEDHLKVEQVVKFAIEYWGSGEWTDVSDPSQPHEAGLLKLDISKALQELEWKPKLNASEAIKWTIDWYKIPDGSKYAYTVKQIDEYFNL
jgi:CDP-glucose 4,6-dehydratase